MQSVVWPQSSGSILTPSLIVQIDTDDPTPMLGYPVHQATARSSEAIHCNLRLQRYLRNRCDPRAAWNRDSEYRRMYPFSDLTTSPERLFIRPSLTTVRQPLNRMGEVAAQTLLDRIEGRKEYPSEIAIEPELVVRESTANAPLSC